MYTSTAGQVTYTFDDFDREMGETVRIAARMHATIGGRTVPLRPQLTMELGTGTQSRTPAYLPSGGVVSIVSVDPNTHSVQLELPGMEAGSASDVLAVELSTKPLINLVWMGAILMLSGVFLTVLRRAGDLRRRSAEAASPA